MNIHMKQLYSLYCSVYYIYSVVDIDIQVSSHLKGELAWAVDKRLRIISTLMLFNKQ